jgi:hypothetical protein
MSQPNSGLYPPRFVDLKRQIASSYPDFENRVTRAWKEVVEELVVVSERIQAGGSEVSPLCLYPPPRSSRWQTLIIKISYVF